MSKFTTLGILQNVDSGDNSMSQNKSIFVYSQYGYNPANYFHMKTNLNSTYFMWMFEAVGYDYAGAAAIRTAWVVHKSGGGLYRQGYANITNAYVAANNTYLSSDGYLVVVAYTPYYWQGFTLNAYNTAPQYYSNLSNGGMVTVTDTAFSGGNSGVY
jgi:hypothetical protein